MSNRLLNYTHFALSLGVMAMVFSGCTKPMASADSSTMMEVPPPEHLVSADLKASPDSPKIQTTTSIAVSLPQLAYNYNFSFQASAKGVESLAKSDLDACNQAGVSACQMISQTSQKMNEEGSIHKTLELRVSPAWLKSYQSGLEKGLKTVGARMVSNEVSSEDLSLTIVDTEARLKNKEALRDRLQQILRSGSGKIADLIEAETQLARVQEDIDAAKSTLLVMRSRVATIHLSLSYSSETLAASSGTFAPVMSALKGILGNIMGMIGFIINLTSSLLPLGLLTWLGLWLARKPIKRFFERRKQDRVN